MDNHWIPRVVRSTSLAGFLKELPTPSAQDAEKPVLRLLNRQSAGQFNAALVLSLQGVNAAGEVVWLSEAHSVSWLYGKPFGLAAESAWAGMSKLESVVRAFLEAQGFEVRSGDYGLPESVKPLAASFECAKWVQVSETEWAVRPVASIAELAGQ